MTHELAVGIFVVRAWYEEDQFRARVTRCVDIGEEPTTDLATADLNELVHALDTWLTELAQRASEPGPPAR